MHHGNVYIRTYDLDVSVYDFFLIVASRKMLGTLKEKLCLLNNFQGKIEYIFCLLLQNRDVIILKKF